jgi:hypothetical protein
MRSDPMFDPFVEAGYLGYSLRAVAHRLPGKAFRPHLEIRDYRYSNGELLYERVFDEFYFEADPALNRAMGKGYQVIDDSLHLINLDAYIEL